MTPAEALARYDKVVRRVVSDHHRVAQHYGYEWDDMYQEAVMVVLESLPKIDAAKDSAGYVGGVVRNTMLQRFTYTPASAGDHARLAEGVRFARKGDNMGGDIARAARVPVSIEPRTEIPDETLMPDLGLAEDEAQELALRLLHDAHLTSQEADTLQHLMYGEPSARTLAARWGVNVRMAYNRIENAKQVLADKLQIEVT